MNFESFVVRGPTAHIGSIEAVATMLTENHARFVDTDADNFVEGQPATIDFFFSGHELEVRGENTLAYHGMRASFDGTYYKKPYPRWTPLRKSVCTKSRILPSPA
ncbi:MAG: hypothetical protein SNJ52_05775 [Verrucomicrobiia bacterium]